MNPFMYFKWSNSDVLMWFGHEERMNNETLINVWWKLVEGEEGRHDSVG